MTDDRIALLQLVEQRADGDLVREILAIGAERIMEAELVARTGAAKGAGSPLREVQRNGYRDRDWGHPRGPDRAGGSQAAQGPRRRPSVFEPRRTAEKALVAVIPPMFMGSRRALWMI